MHHLLVTTLLQLTSCSRSWKKRFCWSAVVRHRIDVQLLNTVIAQVFVQSYLTTTLHPWSPAEAAAPKKSIHKAEYLQPVLTSRCSFSTARRRGVLPRMSVQLTSRSSLRVFSSRRTVGMSPTSTARRNSSSSLFGYNYIKITSHHHSGVFRLQSAVWKQTRRQHSKGGPAQSCIVRML